MHDMFTNDAAYFPAKYLTLTSILARGKDNVGTETTGNTKSDGNRERQTRTNE